MENEFESVMSERTDIELLQITTTNRNDYQPKAVMAAEIEIKKRNLSTEKIKEIIANVNIDQNNENEKRVENEGKMFMGIDLEKLFKKKIRVLSYLILISELFALLIQFKNNLSFNYSYFLMLPAFSFLIGFCLVSIPFLGIQMNINIFNSVNKKGLIKIDKGLINIDFNYGLFLLFIIGWLLASFMILFIGNF